MAEEESACDGPGGAAWESDAARKGCVNPAEAGIVEPTEVVRVAVGDAVPFVGAPPLTEATTAAPPERKKERSAAAADDGAEMAL